MRAASATANWAKHPRAVRSSATCATSTFLWRSRRPQSCAHCRSTPDNRVTKCPQKYSKEVTNRSEMRDAGGKEAQRRKRRQLAAIRGYRRHCSASSRADYNLAQFLNEIVVNVSAIAEFKVVMGDYNMMRFNRKGERRRHL
jgi:hypothetical protein